MDSKQKVISDYINTSLAIKFKMIEIMKNKLSNFQLENLSMRNYNENSF